MPYTEEPSLSVPTTPRASAGRRFRRALTLVAAAVLAMAAIGRGCYTSLGFDWRGHSGPDRINREYRLRWPGDGSVGLALRRIREPIFEPLDRFDLAFRVFAEPTTPLPVSRWNRAGFWFTRETSALEGAEVRSVGPGIVDLVQWLPGYGETVIVNHGRSFYTIYGHLGSINVRPDDRVDPGHLLGTVGDTGSLKGVCLHFEVRQGGEAQDPMLWLR